MALKPWYRVVTPREDLREGKPLDASEFAVHLDQVRDGRAPTDYQKPERFFDRTYLTKNLLAFAETAARPTSLFHYRTQAGAETDFVLSRGARLIPVEVKAAATLRAQDASGLRSFLADHSESTPFGVVLYTGDSALPLGDRVVGLPLSSILAGPRAP